MNCHDFQSDGSSFKHRKVVYAQEKQSFRLGVFNCTSGLFRNLLSREEVSQFLNTDIHYCII